MTTAKKPHLQPQISAPTGAPGSLANFLLPLANLPRVLTEAELRQWFGTADLPPDVAFNLAGEITKLYLATPELRSRRPERDAQVAKALSVLQKELPAYLEAGQQLLKVRPIAPRGLRGLEKRLALISALLEVVDGLIQEKMFPLRRAGRSHELWHGVAQHLGPQILAAFDACGIAKTGFGNATSPALRVLKRALEWLGVKKLKEDAIIKAMRKPTSKGNK